MSAPKHVTVSMTVAEAIALNNRIGDVATYHRQNAPLRRIMKKIRAELDRVDPVKP